MGTGQVLQTRKLTVTVQRSHTCGHVSCRSLFWRKIVKNHGIICVILAVLTCLPLIKTFCISLSKLRVVYLLFSRYIVFEFLACFSNSCVCDRFSAWSCPLNRAVYSTPHSVWSVYTVSMEWIMLPFIHSRHNTKDRSLGVGRDISWCFICYRNNRWQKRGICIAPVKHVVGFGVRQSNKV